MDKLCVLLLWVYINLHLAWGVIINVNKYVMCDDCIPIRKCKEASPYMNMTAENVEHLMPFFCGVTHSFNVCCSKMKRSQAVDTMQAVRRQSNLKLLPDSCGNIYNTMTMRIVSGVFASMYEYPWMVLIAYNTNDGVQFYCSGTLINPRYVLTAAHCIQSSDPINSIRIGEYEVGKDRDCDDNNVCESNLQDINVEEEIVHEDYDMYDNNVNDIGLLRLKKEVNMSFENAGTVCLPLTEDLQTQSIAKKYATVAGWGWTEFRKDSSTLLKVGVPVQPDEDCYPNFSRKSSSLSKVKMICAGTYGKDSCKGDSGGPLMIPSVYKGIDKMVQFGIVSVGPFKCGSIIPAVYTDVRKYVDWILDHIRE